MSIAAFLLLLAVICGFCAAVAAVLIAAALDRHRIKTPFPFLGALVFRNLAAYRAITRMRTGAVGPLFYAYVIPINAALVLVLTAWAVAAGCTSEQPTSDAPRSLSFRVLEEATACGATVLHGRTWHRRRVIRAIDECDESR